MSGTSWSVAARMCRLWGFPAVRGEGSRGWEILVPWTDRMVVTVATGTAGCRRLWLAMADVRRGCLVLGGGKHRERGGPRPVFRARQWLHKKIKGHETTQTQSKFDYHLGTFFTTPTISSTITETRTANIPEQFALADVLEARNDTGSLFYMRVSIFNVRLTHVTLK